MTDDTPVYGCTINGVPAMPILISEYNRLVTGLAEAEGERDRLKATVARVQALADEHPAGIDTALIEEALDTQQAGPAAAQATDRVSQLAAAFRDCLAAFNGMRNSDNTGDIQHWQARVTPREYETWQTTARAAGPTTAGVHVYLSTGCLHGDHDYCKSMTGLNGAKRPASCKKCGAKCICSCHEQPGPA